MAIIYRDVSHNPGRLSTRTNLEYMRAIRVHISSMAQEHLLAPSLTKLLEDMVESAEEVVRRHGDGQGVRSVGNRSSTSDMSPGS